MAKRNPAWSREELILALDLYFDLDSSQFTSSNPKVIALSQVLNKLNVHAEKPDESRFRNPNGVSMKLSNFLRFDANYQGTGLQRGGQLEQEIWDEYLSDREQLRRDAARIKASID